MVLSQPGGLPTYFLFPAVEYLSIPVTGRSLPVPPGALWELTDAYIYITDYLL